MDSLGRTGFEQRYTGNSSSTYAVYATARYAFDFVGGLNTITHPNGTTQTRAGHGLQAPDPRRRC